MSYPSMMTDVLNAGGVLVGLNPLLVGQDGTSYISGATSWLYPNKVLSANVLSFIYTSNNGVTYNSNKTTARVDTIGNKSTHGATVGDVLFMSNISSNAVANISTPKAVQQVGNYAVATNSHSIYRGANLTTLLGKVPTSPN